MREGEKHKNAMGSFRSNLNDIVRRLVQPRVLNSTLWLSADKSISLVCGFAVTVFAARQFGPSQFGEFSYYLSYVAIFLPLMSLGLDRILMREMQDRPTVVRSILVTALLSRLFASLGISLLGLLLFTLFESSELAFATVCVLFAGQSFQSFRVYNMWFQHKGLNEQIARLRILCLSAGTIAKLTVILVRPEILPLVIVVAVEQILLSTGHYLLYTKSSKEVEQESRGVFRGDILREMFAQSKFLILSGFAYLIYLRVDVIMLTQLVDSREAGIYSVAARITEACQIFPEALLAAVFPGLLALHRDAPEAYLDKITWFFQVLFFMGFSVALLGYVLAPIVLPFVFGDSFSSSVPVLQIHLWACCFLYMRVMLSHWLVAEKFAQFSLLSHALGAVANVALNMLLIPRFGAIGAAYATLVSVMISSYGCLLLSRRTLPLFYGVSRAFNVFATARRLIQLAFAGKNPA